MKRVLDATLGAVIAASLLVVWYVQRTPSDPYVIPAAKWTYSLSDAVQVNNRDGFFHPATGDYYQCEPRFRGYTQDGTVIADNINREFVVYKANHERIMTGKGCWK